MTGNKQTQEEIADRCGCTWREVVKWFKGKSVSEIKAECDYCWPSDDNQSFAEEIFEALN